MSYSLELKTELMSELPHANCCRRAYALGLAINAIAAEGGFAVTHNASAVRGELERAFLKIYQKQPEAVGKTLVFKTKKASRMAPFALGVQPEAFSCEACARYFLRGAMIAAGSMTDPGKSYHLEFVLTTAAAADFLTSLLEKGSSAPKRRTVAGGISVYYKKSAAIEDTLSKMGAQNAFFDVVNAKIEGELRNRENRSTNCDTQNIKKAVDAADKIRRAVQRIAAADAMPELSPELQETAHLRTENPEASLIELAAMHNPPITKSGLNHRLQKIMQIAARFESRIEV